jgi:membrane associated rhomboid family serine protease
VFLPLRDDAPRPRLPIVTIGLVLANSLVFLLQQVLPETQANLLLYAGGAVPFEIANMTDLVDDSLHPTALVPLPFTVVTSMFLHGSPAHLFGNLWFLWIFGDNVEGAMGGLRFLLFYLLCGCAAAAAQIATTPESTIPIVGASGAIAGVLGAYFLLFPRAKVEVLLFLVVVLEIVIVPAFFVLGVWLIWQLLAEAADGSIAVWAHVFGFLGGAAVCKLFVRRLTPTEARARESWIPTVAESSSLPL